MMVRDNGNQIRIKDIAAKAGCSIGTVDRVIHNRGKVSEDVKKRIHRIMEELDYKPNINARILASKRPLTLGILLPSHRKGEFWELPSLGIREAMERYAEQGFRINAIQFPYNTPENFHHAGMKMISERVDGVILSPASYRESVLLVRSYFQNHIPFILIDSDMEGVPSLSFIGKNPVQSGVTVAKLIHQLTRHIPGLKRLWIINLAVDLNHMNSLLARESGFMTYFAGKHLREEYGFITFDMEDKGTQKAIDLKLAQMLKDDPPHGIYVTGSRVHKIAASLKRAGLEPKPLLIGHDLIRANRERLQDDSIDFLIEEEAKRQGYLAVESMIRSIIYQEKIPGKQIMNLMIYTRENLPL